jgi:hypothetical protein
MLVEVYAAGSATKRVETKSPTRLQPNGDQLVSCFDPTTNWPLGTY